MVRRFDLCLIWLTFFVNLATFELRIKNKAGKEGVYTVGAFTLQGLIFQLIPRNRHEEGRISKEGRCEA